MWLLYRRRIKRKCWIHPTNQSREHMGTFCTLFEELRRHSSKFFNFFRISIASFDELHEKFKNEIHHQNTRNSIPSRERLALTLKYVVNQYKIIQCFLSI